MEVYVIKRYSSLSWMEQEDLQDSLIDAILKTTTVEDVTDDSPEID